MLVPQILGWPQRSPGRLMSAPGVHAGLEPPAEQTSVDAPLRGTARVLGLDPL